MFQKLIKIIKFGKVKDSSLGNSENIDDKSNLSLYNINIKKIKIVTIKNKENG